MWTSVAVDTYTNMYKYKHKCTLIHIFVHLFSKSRNLFLSKNK